MKEVYPVILIKDEDQYVVRIPDFNTVTEGKDIVDAIYMARDAIGMIGIELEDEGKELPKPYSKKVTLEANEKETLVDVDFAEYRKKYDTRMVKKNCTIPYNLSVEAERLGLNFSRILQEAVRERIQKATR